MHVTSRIVFHLHYKTYLPPDYLMFEEGDRQLQYWNYLVYLIRLLMSSFNAFDYTFLTFLVSYMPGKGEWNISEMQAQEGTILSLTLVTKEITWRDNISIFMKFSICNSWSMAKPCTKPCTWPSSCLRLSPLAWDASNSALNNLVPVYKSVLKNNPD